MAKTGKKRRLSRKREGFTLPLAVVAGFAAPTIKIFEASRGGVSAGAREAGRILTGFDFWEGRFVPQAMLYGLAPIAVGALIHKFVGGRMGVNSVMRQAGIPFIRL